MKVSPTWNHIGHCTESGTVLATLGLQVRSIHASHFQTTWAEVFAQATFCTLVKDVTARAFLGPGARSLPATPSLLLWAGPLLRLQASLAHCVARTLWKALLWITTCRQKSNREAHVNPEDHDCAVPEFIVSSSKMSIRLEFDNTELVARNLLPEVAQDKCQLPQADTNVFHLNYLDWIQKLKRLCIVSCITTSSKENQQPGKQGRTYVKGNWTAR